MSGKYKLLLIILISIMFSCQKNFNPEFDSAVRDLHLNLLMAQTNDNCKLLFDDYGEADAFRATVYIYDRSGKILRKHQDIYKDYIMDTLNCVIPKVDTSKVSNIIVVGEYVALNEYEDVTSCIIHRMSEDMNNLNVYTLTNSQSTETYCSQAIFSLSGDNLIYDVNMEPSFSHFFLVLNNSSNILRYRFKLKSNVFYYFIPRQTGSSMTTSGQRYNTAGTSGGYSVFSYIPGPVNRLELELQFDKSDFTCDTLMISQEIKGGKIYQCSVDCQKLIYNCM